MYLCLLVEEALMLTTNIASSSRYSYIEAHVTIAEILFDRV